MKKLFRKIADLVLDRSRSIRERLFITLTFSAISVVVIALIGDILYQENPIENIMLTILVILVPIISLWGVKTDKVELHQKNQVIATILIISRGRQ